MRNGGFIVVGPAGEATIREDLTDAEIGRMVAADFTVIEVSTPIATAAIRVAVVDEDGSRRQL